MLPGPSAFEITTLWRYTNLFIIVIIIIIIIIIVGGSVVECLACWTQVQKGLGSNCSYDAVG